MEKEKTTPVQEESCCCCHKKKEDDMSIPLIRTKDILATLGASKTHQFLCGFSMETQNMLENSRTKIAKKNLDMIVANNLKVAGAGFGTDTNVITLIADDMEKEKTTPVQEESCCCCHKKKERDAKEYKDLMNRLSRIEGQVRGVKGMLEKDAYCVDILTQVAAINAALNSFNKVLLANHIKTCVVENVRNGDDSVIDELVTTMQKLMK